MAVSPVEWIVIAVVIIVFIMMGPKKIPELARSLGQARREFVKGTSNGGAFGGSNLTEDESLQRGTTLTETAEKMGIETEGVTLEEVSNEILRRAQTKRTSQMTQAGSGSRT